MSLDHHLYGMTSDYQWLPVRVNASGHVSTVDQPADAADVEPVASPWYYAAASGGITDTVSYALVGLPQDGKRSYVTSLQAQNVSGTATEIVVRSGSTVLWRGSLQASMTAPRAFRFRKPLRGGVDEILSVACLTTGTQTYVNAQGYQDATRSGAVVYGSFAEELLGNEPDGVAMDFRDGSVVVRDTTTPANNFSGNVNDWLTYTSPSSKWVMGENGLYSSGTTIRTEYNAAGTALGARIEPAATNLTLRSNAFGTLPWVANRTSVAASSALSPEGVANAFKLTEDSSTNTHLLSHDITKAASAIAYTLSGFVKAAERSWVEIAVFDGATDGNRQWINLSTGAAGSTAVIGAGFTSVAFSSSMLLNGWVYFKYRFTTSATTTLRLLTYTSTGDAVDNYAGDGSSGIHLYQFDVVTGSVAGSPITTAGSTVTRTADLLTKVLSAVPFSASVGTVMTTGIMSELNASAYRPTCSFDDNSGGSLNRIMQIVNTSGLSASLLVTAGGALQANVASSGGISADVAYRIASKWQANDFASSTNGATAGTDVSGSIPAGMARLTIGNEANNGNKLQSHLTTFLYVPRAVANASLPTFGA